MEEQGEQQFFDLDDIPPFITPYPILQPEALDHDEAQRILKEEDHRIKATGVEAFMKEQAPKEGLEGPPLSLEQCKALVPDSFVRTQLFRQADTSRQKNPKQKYPPSLSMLQHVDLSKVILERFIQKNKCLPNHNQVPIYFVQHLFCEEFLHKQVNWDDKGTLGGVAMGRPIDRKRAKTTGTPLKRTKPLLFTPEEQQNLATNAAQGVFLASQGRTAQQVLQEVHQLRAENQGLRDLVARYQALYGDLEPPSQPTPSQPTPLFNVEDLMDQTNETINLDD